MVLFEDNRLTMKTLLGTQTVAHVAFDFRAYSKNGVAAAPLGHRGDNCLPPVDFPSRLPEKAE